MTTFGSGDILVDECVRRKIVEDPDGVSVTGLIKGDKILHKTLLNELKGATLSLRKVAGKLINDCLRGGMVDAVPVWGNGWRISDGIKCMRDTRTVGAGC
ncbi:hypothetical protein S83_061896 [Arachis hypogaea]